MEAKKISFGFSKVTKKPNILPAKASIVAGREEAKKVELIKCLEGKEIKLVDGEKPAEAPLVIQMATNQKTSTALASLMKRRAVLLGEDETPDDLEPQSIGEVTTVNDSDNLEKRAARELLASVQMNNTEGLEGDKLVLPAVKADELPLDGAKEATLDDYDSIPIQQFGLAMLRGMGWVDPPPKKKGQGPIADDAPFLRPKGMGLGADKALKPKPLLVQPEKNEVLEIKKQAYVRIMGGKLKDQYGQVEGFDDHAGRVIVKMAIGGAKEAFNEFLCQPVSRKEYSQYGKCINTAKYEEFKKLENKHGQIIVKREKSADRDKKSHRGEDREERYREDERRRYREEDREQRQREDERRRYKDEDRKPYRTDKVAKDEEDRADRRRDIADSRASSSSTSTSTYRASREEERRRDTQDKRLKREEDRETKTYKNEDQRQRSSDDEADDTGESTESDSDSAYERRKHKSSSKSKKKKSKKAKSKSSRRKASNVESNTDDSSDEYRRHSTKHKKKTKKSKHARSRTRSRSRSRSRAGRSR